MQVKIPPASVLKRGLGGQIIADACPTSPIIHVDIVSVTNVVDHVGTLRPRLYQYAVARIAVDCVMEDAGIDRIPIGMDINPGIVPPHHIVIGNIVVAGAKCDTPALAIINAIVMDEVIAIGIIIRFGFSAISCKIMNAPGDVIMNMTPIDQVPRSLNVKPMIHIFCDAIMMDIHVDKFMERISRGWSIVIIGYDSPSSRIFDFAIPKPDVVSVAGQNDSSFVPVGINAEAIKYQILNCGRGKGNIDIADQIHGLAVESGNRDWRAPGITGRKMCSVPAIQLFRIGPSADKQGIARLEHPESPLDGAEGR